MFIAVLGDMHFVLLRLQYNFLEAFERMQQA